jgi:hypothetical protein
MDKLQVVKGPRNGYSYVRFSCDARVRVSGSVQIGSQVYVNPDNYQVTFYLGDTKKDDEQFTINGGETHFTANVYLPQGQLKVTGGYSYGDYGFGRGDCDRDDDDPRYFGMGNSYVYMTGVFIAEEIVGYGKNVIWNSFHCGSAPVTVMSSQPAKELSVSKETVEAGNEATALQVTVMPNPSSTSFKLQLHSRYTTPVDMRVMDSRGRVVESKQHLGANGTVEVGWGYAGGTYFAEFVQGNQRKTVQLIKIN